MNWQIGLRRISAVIWSVIGIVYGGLFLLMGLNGDHFGRLALIALLGLGALLIAHKATCWIINGFFASK